MKHLVTSLLCAAALPLAAQAQIATISSITFDCEEADSAAVDPLAGLEEFIQIGDYHVVLDGQLSGVTDNDYNIIVPPIYDDVNINLENNVAVVTKGNLEGIVSLTTGKTLVKPTYDNVYLAPAGRAMVNYGEYWNLIDIQNGRKLIKKDLDDINRTPIDGIFEINIDGHYGLVNQKGEVIVPCVYLQEEGDYSYFLPADDFRDRMTGNIVKPKYDNILLACDGNFGADEENIRVSSDGKYGMVDAQFHEVIPLVYDGLLPFKEGYAGCVIDGKYGYIDHNNTVVIPCQFSWSSPFSDGRATVNKDGKWYFIDTKGNVTASIAGTYVMILPYSQNYWLTGDDEELGLVDIEGHVILPCAYDDIAIGNDDNWIRAMKDDKVGVFDSKGRKRVDFIYDMVGDINEDMIAVQNDDKYGYITPAGKEIVPCIYDDAYGANEGMASVKRDGKWGFVNTAGKEVIPCIYDDCSPNFDDGTVSVMLDGEYFLIDKNGKRVQESGIESTCKE